MGKNLYFLLRTWLDYRSKSDLQLSIADWLDFHHGMTENNVCQFKAQVLVKLIYMFPSS